MKKFLAIIILTSTLGACNKEPETLNSPCVGAKGSPCEREPINQHVVYHAKV